MAAECMYKELDQYLEDLLINSFIGDGMMVEIIRNLSSIVDTNSVTSA